MATAIPLPKLGQSVESCIIVEWQKKEGDKVTQGEVICEIETDKASLEVESSVSGVVLEIFFQAGDEVPVHTYIAAVGELGESVSHFRPDNTNLTSCGSSSNRQINVSRNTQAVNSQLLTEPISKQSGLDSKISPRADALAKKLGIDLPNVQGTGPSNRIMEKDVQLAALNRQPLTLLARMVAAEKNLVIPTSGSGIGGRITLNDLGSEISPSTSPPLVNVRKQAILTQNMRKGIAERMLNSVQSTARLTLNSSADARSLLSFCQQLKENVRLQQITINDLILFLVSRVLIDYPQLNLLFTQNSISRSKHVNLGFAVDTKRGLMIPVLKHAESLSLEEMFLETKRLSSACVEGKISPDDLEDGTFTVANLGSLGIESFTPMLNFPQVGILGVGYIDSKPVVVNGKLEFIDHIGLSLTVNHQTVRMNLASNFLYAFSQQLSEIDLVIGNEQ